MGDTRHACPRCKGGGFWRNLADAVRRAFAPRQREDRLMYIPIELIDANPFQPREYVLEGPLEGLRDSIERYGVIVPIIVNRQGRRYTLVAGQRRLQAARELGFKFVPAIVRTLSPREMMEVGTLENLHRESLSRIDVVQMFDRIRRKHSGIGEQDMAEAMGLDLESIHHARRLLELPVPVLEALRAGMISEDHAQILCEIKDPDVQLEVIERAFADKLDIQVTQELVDRVLQKEPAYVTADQAAHFHSPSCAFAQLIPDERKLKFYSRREVSRRGKIPCMQCL
jgi:ParB family chromosome partitioning protein